MSEQLVERLRALRDAGDVDELFVEVFTLDEDGCFGLLLDGRWATLRDGGPVAFEPSTASVFVQLLEHGRDEIDVLMAQGAAAQGLPPEAVAESLPAVALVGAVLGMRSHHYCRLALMWLRPTELRPLRAQIAALAEDADLPEQLRALARRLTVPS